MMDIAYAVYSLAERQITKQDYWLYFIPVGCAEEVTITKEPQNLKDTEMDKFSQRMELYLVKLYNKVQDEI